MIWSSVPRRTWKHADLGSRQGHHWARWPAHEISSSCHLNISIKRHWDGSITIYYNPQTMVPSIFHLYPLLTKNLPNTGSSSLQCRCRAAPAQQRCGFRRLLSRARCTGCPSRRGLGGARGGCKAVLWLRSLGVEVLAHAAWHRDGTLMAWNWWSVGWFLQLVVGIGWGMPVERSSSQGSSDLNKLRADSLVWSGLKVCFRESGTGFHINWNAMKCNKISDLQNAHESYILAKYPRTAWDWLAPLHQ